MYIVYRDIIRLWVWRHIDCVRLTENLQLRWIVLERYLLRNQYYLIKFISIIDVFRSSDLLYLVT